MEAQKPVLKSKAIWGNLISLSGIITAWIAAKTHLPAEQVEPIVMALLASGIGNLWSILGRILAKKQIGGLAQ